MNWTITPEACRDLLLAKKNVYLLDVRDPEELSEGKIDGSHMIPLAELGDRSDEVPRDVQVVVYCAHGMRSLEATYLLRSSGWSNAVSLEGGLAAWQELKNSSN